MSLRRVRVPSSSQISAILGSLEEEDGEVVNFGLRKCGSGLDAKLRTSMTIRILEEDFVGI